MLGVDFVTNIMIPTVEASQERASDNAALKFRCVGEEGGPTRGPQQQSIKSMTESFLKIDARLSMSRSFQGLVKLAQSVMRFKIIGRGIPSAAFLCPSGRGK